MVIIGDNLSQLVKQHGIVKDLRDVEEFSISLRIDNVIYLPKNPYSKKKLTPVIKYDKQSVDKFYTQQKVDTGAITLEPYSPILACSSQKVSIPLGYIGFIQTKGTLARHFVTVHLSDAQIEPGFKGKITFEMVNFSNFRIEIPVNAKVSQLFLHKCSMTAKNGYNGHYNDSLLPTIPAPHTGY